MFPSTIAGSLPKPSWLAEPNKLWPQWKLAGDELAQGKLDATLLAIKLQEDAGIDIVCDGEMSRQHFVHGFLEFVDGIDFAHKVEMGIRGDRYKAMVPQVNGELKLKGRVHQTETRYGRAHTKRKLKVTLPGPMTISDTVADRHYGEHIKRPQLRIEHPEHRDQSANRGSVPGRERRVALPAMKEVKAVGAVVDERRVVPDPSLRPQPPEDEFELGLDGLGHDQAGAAKTAGGHALRERLPGQRP